MNDREDPAAGGGLLHSVRNLAHTLIAAAQTRLEILATELEEERLHLEQLLTLAVAAAFCVAMGVLLAVLFIVVFFWDTHRLESIAVLAGTFLAGGAAFAWALRSRARARGKPFAATRGEFARDSAALKDSSEAEPR
jgi:uncharacterized membrane protein YqjE